MPLAALWDLLGDFPSFGRSSLSLQFLVKGGGRKIGVLQASDQIKGGLYETYHR